MKKAKERVEALLQVMDQANIDYYVIPTADFHSSEYVSDFFKVREYISGFTGSNGTLVISRKECGLWTDGRYFVQAQLELEGSGIKLFRMGQEGVPTIKEYLKENAQHGNVIAFDGRVVDAQFGIELEKELSNKGVTLKIDKDLIEAIWSDRPKLPNEKVWMLTDDQAGEKVESKLEAVRKIMLDEKTTSFLVSKLDDIMWLFNIRGNDVEYNPVALSYAFITMKSAFLFIQDECISNDIKEELAKSGVTVMAYQSITSFLEDYHYDGKTMLDTGNINYLLYEIVKNKCSVVTKSNPTTRLKAVKNKTELCNIREIYIKDSAVLTRFLRYMKLHVGKEKITEVSAASMLDQMRSEIDGFIDLSFTTISAYKENAAMMHYEASDEHPREIEAEGLYLVDSGGQYLQGTTDVTRTIALGDITDEMKMHFTKTVCGMLRLSNAKFLYGCSGKNVDILARQPLWECFIDYKCGTGHGIGYILNVHEGPQGIRWRYTAGMKDSILEEGMIVSNEPGVYIEGSHGIRIENICEIVKEEKNDDGQFMGFHTLTYVPIDLDAIDKKYMDQSDVQKLNEYHRQVFDNLVPYMNEEELIWLKEATRSI